MPCAGHRIARILLESALKKRSSESQVPAANKEGDAAQPNTRPTKSPNFDEKQKEQGPDRAQPYTNKPADSNA